MEKEPHLNARKQLLKGICPDPPDKPFRDSGKIYCETTDPDEGREYAALIHVVNNVETVILQGDFFDPFDGSSHECDAPVSENNYYLSRSYCTVVGAYQDAIEVGGPTNIPECRRQFSPGPELIMPTPPTPVLGPGSRPNHIPIYFAADACALWNKQLAALESRGVTVERARLTRYILEGYDAYENPIWKTLKKGQENNANKEILFNGTNPNDLFNQSPKLDQRTSRKDIYGYIADVMFCFPQEVSGDQLVLGSHSEPLMVSGFTGQPPRRSEVEEGEV